MKIKIILFFALLGCFVSLQTNSHQNNLPFQTVVVQADEASDTLTQLNNNNNNNSEAQDSENKETLETYSIWWQVNNFAGFIVRFLGICLTMLLYAISKGLEGGIETVLGLMNFYKDSSLGGFRTAIYAISIGFLSVMLMFVGYKILLGKNVSIGNVYLNVLLILVSFFALSPIMNEGLKVTQSFYNSYASIGSNTTNKNEFYQPPSSVGKFDSKHNDTLSFQIFSSNVVDLQEAQKQNFPKDTSKVIGKGLSADSLATLGTALETYTSSVDDSKSSAFKEKIVNGSVEKIAKGNFLGIGDETLFRFGIRFAPIFIGLLVICVAYIFAIVTLAKTVMNLAGLTVIFIMVALTDIEQGQRLKALWKDIFDQFLTIWIVCINLRIFCIFNAWLAQKLQGHLIVYLIVALVGAMYTVDGLDIFKKHFGLDAGVKDGFRTIIAMNQGTQLLRSAGAMGSNLKTGLKEGMAKDSPSGQTTPRQSSGFSGFAGRFVGGTLKHSKNAVIGETAKSFSQKFGGFRESLAKESGTMMGESLVQQVEKGGTTLEEAINQTPKAPNSARVLGSIATKKAIQKTIQPAKENWSEAIGTPESRKANKAYRGQLQEEHKAKELNKLGNGTTLADLKAKSSNKQANTEDTQRVTDSLDNNRNINAIHDQRERVQETVQHETGNVQKSFERSSDNYQPKETISPTITEEKGETRHIQTQATQHIKEDVMENRSTSQIHEQTVHTTEKTEHIHSKEPNNLSQKEELNPTLDSKLSFREKEKEKE